MYGNVVDTVDCLHNSHLLFPSGTEPQFVWDPDGITDLGRVCPVPEMSHGYSEAEILSHLVVIPFLFASVIVQVNSMMDE